MPARLGRVFYACGHQSPLPTGERRVPYPCAACRPTEVRPIPQADPNDICPCCGANVAPGVLH